MINFFPTVFVYWHTSVFLLKIGFYIHIYLSTYVYVHTHTHIHYVMGLEFLHLANSIFSLRSLHYTYTMIIDITKISRWAFTFSFHLFISLFFLPSFQLITFYYSSFSFYCCIYYILKGLIFFYLSIFLDILRSHYNHCGKYERNVLPFLLEG